MHYIIFNIKENDWQAIKDSFIEDKEKENAMKITNILRLQRSFRDNLKNDYKMAFENQKKIWEQIPIYEL